ncbi:MAG: NCS1 family nucleobase:cation symporter-1 [Verrucomicrobiota bacterium]
MNSIQADLTASQLAEIKESKLFNSDLAPIPSSARKWRVGSFAALWISMAACIPTYMLASGLIDPKIGMNWSQAILTIFLGNLIVLVPMILNAHAGTKYGIPFPVYCRAAFGTKGANVPALLRALVACGWFGIQTWIGGNAIYKILCVFHEPLASGSTDNFLGITGAQFLCFLFFWGVNMLVVYKGINCIRWLLNIKAPVLIALGLLLLWWAYKNAGGFGPILSQPSQFALGQPKDGQFLAYFFPALTGMIGFWATLSLNIPDFSRYAHSQRDQVIGQALGLPATMALYSFIGVAVTSATTIIYGKTIWDPVDVLTQFNNPVVLVVAMLALCVATLATNIAANVVSPANDFAHLAPRHITFRIGGLITGIIGIMMMPWKLVADPSGYIFTWLVGYSALLGPIGGILIADYFVYRKKRLNLVALYQPDGEYRFTNGFSVVAMVALVFAVLPNVPGFLVQIKLISPHIVPDFFGKLYNYAWFVGFILAFLLYLVGKQFSVEGQKVNAPETAKVPANKI